MNLPKIIALYLPQFHEIPENDKWWGKGFTEWTSVRKSKPLFDEHEQPKIPMNDNYYTLNEQTMRWQAQLARKYGIHGFCFYHYWFMGKQLLEKPAEILLANKNIGINFCFSWANQTWSRTWYGYNKEILIEQKYGSKQDWKKHFDYLIPFFKDKRYIKINNMPILVIYQPRDIKKYDEMVSYWKQLAIKNGFKGLYIIETLSSQRNLYSQKSDAGFLYEPGFTINNNFITKFKIKLKSFIDKYLHENNFLLNIFNYNSIYQEILNRKIITPSKKIFIGCFVNWDNTARKKMSAYIFRHFSIQSFEKYIYDIILKSYQNKLEYIFITAWNEWAEGAYLEPDTINKYDYLECIKNANYKANKKLFKDKK